MKISPLLLVLTLPLSGCISFGAAPPPTLLTLESASMVAVGQVQSTAGAKTVQVQIPSVAQALATPRVPVQATPTTVAYVKDAVWSEPPARLFARLLGDTLSARVGRVVLSGAQALTDPGAQLGGDLRAFGLDATARVAVVTYDATLIRAGSTVVQKRRFEAKVPVGAIDAVSAGPALNQAANQVAIEVADWVGR